MKIFSDLHHFDLYYSMQLLFENRLGHELYRPIGLGWKVNNFWDIQKDPEFIECLLSESDGRCAEILSKYKTLLGKEWAVFSLHLPRIGKIQDCDYGHYTVLDKSKNIIQKAISLEAFKNMKFDIIISSLPQHFALFENLRKKYQPQAKHIFQMAAIGWPLPVGTKNAMLNTTPTSSLDGINHVYYRQEFDTSVFSYTAPLNSKVIRSYVHFPVTERLWTDMNLPWNFKFVGKTLGQLSDVVVDSRDLAKEIRNSGFTLHIKPGGESYGHILHNSYAMGRPVIINCNDFNNTMGQNLLTGDTCIDASKYLPHQISDILNEIVNTDKHNMMCEKAYDRFKSVVSFDDDAIKVNQFLERLI